jgi:hypothetical protein
VCVFGSSGGPAYSFENAISSFVGGVVPDPLTIRARYRPPGGVKMVAVSLALPVADWPTVNQEPFSLLCRWT